MSDEADEVFRTLHALRLKGFAKVEVLTDLAGLPAPVVEERLRACAAREWVMFREARQLWQLTPAGREQHATLLAREAAEVAPGSRLSAPYRAFLEVNERFKQLCSDWQVRGTEPNDHADASYDADVLERLTAVDTEVRAPLAAMSAVLGRLASYQPRLAAAREAVAAGDARMFTGVMCGSYHDIWMELHEDLIITQGLDRAAEGSF